MGSGDGEVARRGPAAGTDERRWAGRRLGRWLAAALVAVTLGIMAPGAAAARGSDLLPDLELLPLSEFHIQKATTSRGTRYRLRFSATIVNTGRGTMEVRGRRDCPDLQTCPTMDEVVQRILQRNGRSREVLTDARMKYETSDHHFHWHVIGLERYEIFPLGDQGADARRSRKFGFCFFDGLRHDASLPGAPSSPVYSYSGCGNPGSTEVVHGLSVGWGDIYPWFFGGQFIDITGLPTGRYLVCATADPRGAFLESDETDNQVWQKLRISATGFTLRAAGKGPCAAQLPAG